MGQWRRTETCGRFEGSRANVANLMLARGATRQRDIAIRVAGGAGRARRAMNVDLLVAMWVE